MQDDQGALLRVEASEASLERIALVHGDRAVPDRGMVDGCQLDLERMSTVPARLVHAGVDEETMQPRVEALGVAERRQVAPGAHERLLGGVLAAFRVAQDEARERIEAWDRGTCQDGEGVMIAPPRLLHELQLLHCGPPESGCGATHVAALSKDGGSRIPIVPKSPVRCHGLADACRDTGCQPADTSAWEEPRFLRPGDASGLMAHHRR